MAYSQEQWDRAKAYYESGQYSLSGIQEKTGISRSKISEKAKREQWEQGRNADYIEAKKTLAIKKGTEKGTVIQVLDDIADEQIRHKGLINSNAELIASQIPSMLTGMIEKKVDEETGEVYEVNNITPQDLKLLAETNDRVAITLKVADRHAKSGDVNVQTNTAIQAGVQIYIPSNDRD